MFKKLEKISSISIRKLLQRLYDALEYDSGNRWYYRSLYGRKIPVRLFNNTFHVLFRHLSLLSEQIQYMPSISCSDYEKFFQERCYSRNLPFEFAFKSINQRENIREYIHAFDHAYLSKMIKNVFISLIQFLILQRGTVNLLDFGSGKTCGIYGSDGKALFEEGGIDLKKVIFTAVDDSYKPRSSVFEKSNYVKCHILDFNPDNKFDLITGHHVLEHCYFWEKVIIHLSKLLKNDGYLYMSFPRFNSFYDTVYRLMAPYDHCANFDIDMLKSFSKRFELEMCFSDIYVDPISRFDWICNIYPNSVSKEMADWFYELCVHIDSKLLLGYHHYGHYVVFRKTAE